jgi:hypothetical protein
LRGSYNRELFLVMRRRGIPLNGCEKNGRLGEEVRENLLAMETVSF